MGNWPYCIARICLFPYSRYLIGRKFGLVLSSNHAQNKIKTKYPWHVWVG